MGRVSCYPYLLALPVSTFQYPIHSELSQSGHPSNQYASILFSLHIFRRPSDSNRRQDSAPIVRNERFASLAGNGDRDRDRDRDGRDNRDNRGGGDRGDRPSDRDRGDNRGGDEGKQWGNKSNDAPLPRRSEGSGSNEGGWR